MYRSLTAFGMTAMRRSVIQNVTKGTVLFVIFWVDSSKKRDKENRPHCHIPTNWDLSRCSPSTRYAGIAMHRSLTVFGMTTKRSPVIPSEVAAEGLAQR